MRNIGSITSIYKYVIFLFFCQSVLSQNPINILQSNTLDQLLIHDTIFQKFSGNVIVEYEDFKISCDTILIDEYKEAVRGWGNVNINNDTIEFQTDSINIKQFQNIIFLYKNTIINMIDMMIYGDELEYNYETNEIRYLKGGHVQTQDYDITSQQFTHILEEKTSNFQHLVNATTNEYQILTENLIYIDEIMNFFGKTSIKNSDFIIHCDKGLFKKGDVLKIYNQETIDASQRKIQSDTLLVDIKNNVHYFHNNVNIIINEDTHIIGDDFKQNDQFLTIYNDCYIKLINPKDSIIIYGDTIKINDQKEELEVINNVIVEGKDLEGGCVNMKFKDNYTDIYMNHNPVLWFNDVQITGDEIQLYVKQNKLDSIYIPYNPFIVSPYDSLTYYNQIIGKVLYGKFYDNSIKYVNIEGNSKMKYFEKNKQKNSIIGLNNIEAGNIQLLFLKNNVNQVSSFNQIESNYIEIDRKQKMKQKSELIYFNDFKLVKRVSKTKKINNQF